MEKYTGLEIAVIGVAGRFPQADNINQYWENLKSGKDCISHFSDEDVLADGEPEILVKNPNYVKANAYLENKRFFDSAFFNYRPEEAELMDPQMRIFHECCWEALEDSGYSSAMHKEKIGLFAAAAPNAIWETYAMLKNNDLMVDEFSASFLREITYLSSRISYKFDLKGPSVFLNTACSSSLAAIHYACSSLLLGECTTALAGGVAIHNYSKKGYIYQQGMIHSKDGKCSPFDHTSTGTVPGEGAGVVVLKKLKDAIRDRDNIYAIIKGTGVNNDGNNKVGYTAPSVQGQVEVIMKAMKMAQVGPDSINYIETHGTATELGDSIEIQAINEAFRKLGSKSIRKFAIGSVKSAIGHLDTAAGVAGFIKTVLILKNKKIPPSLYFTCPNTNVDFANSPVYVNTKIEDLSEHSGTLRAGVSSFGIGGTNVHLILEEAPLVNLQSSNKGHQLILLSGKSNAALKRNASRLLEHVNEDSNLDLADIAYTLQTGRAHYQNRKFFVCENKKQLIEMLTREGVAPATDEKLPYGIQNIVFMFSGQGSQYYNMCHGLYLNERLFKEKVDECLQIIERYTKEDFGPVLFKTPGKLNQLEINKTRYAQPLIFAIEFSLANLLITWGIMPDYMIGHSIGEYVAACLSGVFSLEDALKIVIARGELMSNAPKGSMLSIDIQESQLESLLSENNGINLAAVNSETSVVVSGNDSDVEALEARLTILGFQYKKLHTSHAFHSYLMDEVIDQFDKVISAVSIHRPQIPYMSNLTGQIADYEEISKSSYWCEHLRNTVAFKSGIDTLLAKGEGVFIEVGPGRSLCRFVEENPNRGKHHYHINMVRQLNQQINDHKYLIEKLGQLWLYGHELNWIEFCKDDKRQTVQLPTYSFEKTAYLVDVDTSKLIESRNFLQVNVPDDYQKESIHLPCWQQSLLPNEATELGGDKISFLIFTGNSDFSAALATKLTADGHHVIQTVSGQFFRRAYDNVFEINFSEPDDFARLWKLLIEDGLNVKHIIYCASLSHDPPIATYDGIDGKFLSGYLALSYIAKAIAVGEKNEEVRLTVLDNYLAGVTKYDSIDPLKATIQGPAKIIGLELPHVKSKIVDIPYPFASQHELTGYVPIVLNEIFYDSEESFVAYRQMERWVQSFRSLVENQKLNSASKIVSDGVYIVAGGFGGMGFTVAIDLVRNFNARAVILHRSAFPAREDWENWIALNGDLDHISKKIRQIQEAETLGGRFDLRHIDVTIEEDVQRIVFEIINKYARVNGIIWAAGEVDLGGVIVNRQKEDFYKYLSSKVHGLLLFSKFLQFSSLDFIALFSSFGNTFYRSKFGQIAYNAANEFLENFALYAEKTMGLRAFTINWCDWFDVGMTVKTRAQKANITDVDFINTQIKDGISPTEGVNIFHRCLKNKSAGFTIYKGNILEAIKTHRSQYEKIMDSMNVSVSPVNIALAEDDLPYQILGIFAGFFGRDNISVGDDFFELGGDSLKGMTLAARINQKFGCNISITDLYKCPRVQDLSNLILKRTAKTSNRIFKAPAKQSYLLSSAQKRMYFLQRLDKDSTVYNETQLLVIKGELDLEKLKNTFRQLIRRHETLRTAFVFENDLPKQIVLEQYDFELEQFGTETSLPEAINIFVRPFDLSEAPLFRVGIVDGEDKQYLLMIDLHHIITDGISKNVLMKDFTSMYNESELPELHLQYKDYCEWQQSEVQLKNAEASKKFWLDKFSEIPEILELPGDFERPLVKTYVGSSIDFELDTSDARALQLIAETHGVSMFMLLLAVFNVLVGRLANSEDVVIGIPASDRGDADLEKMVGMFINMLPLRNHPESELKFRDFLAAVKLNTLDSMENRGFQYEDLIESLQLERNLSRNPLFEIVYSHENFDFSELTIPGLILSTYKDTNSISKFDLHLITIEKGDVIACSFEYSTALFKKDTILRFIDSFKQIIKNINANIGLKISEIEILPVDEKKKLVKDFNNTATAFNNEITITGLINETFEKTPGAIAIISHGEQFTYGWLNTRSNDIAAILRESSIKRESSVVVIMERGIELITVILGILKAGGKFIPIEPSLPVNRIKTIINSVSAEMIIINDTLNFIIDELKNDVPTVYEAISVDILVDSTLKITKISNFLHQGVQKINTFLANCGIGEINEDLAYVIFTSGSSGEPKGVAVKHKPVINLIEWVNKTFNVCEKDKILFVSSISFDLSIYDIFGLLAAGGTIRIASRAELEDPELLANIIIKEGITFWDSAPAMLQQVLPFLEDRKDRALQQGCLRLAFLSGDWIPLATPPLLKSIFNKLRFIALGGATEATVWSNFFEVAAVDKGWKSIPYGKPIQNAKYLILDKNHNVCPIGVTGDLYIGGQCLANGYINDKELTHKKFIDSPFDEGEIIYNTGDMAKWHTDGNIEFLGRKDSQVKIRGYRIELGEIEKRLNQFNGIDQLIVQVSGENKFEKFIVCYYVSKYDISENEITTFLNRFLPKYMIPKYFIRLDKIPMTQNGKVNRRLLPSPQLHAEGERLNRPRTNTERVLTDVWSKILHIDYEKIGLKDDFFFLGGHSIMAVQLINIIQREFSVNVKLRRIFENSTIEQLAVFIERSTAERQYEIVKTEQKEWYLTSPAQERMFLEQLKSEGSLAYNISDAYHISGNLDIEKLVNTFTTLIQRHESLRTCFSLAEQGVIQKVNAEVKLQFDYVNKDVEKDVPTLFTEFIKPFDLSSESLFRARILNVGVNEHILFIDIHHIVCDGVSLNILMNEFKSIYSGVNLPVLNLKYIDYAQWQRNRNGCIEEQKAYWLNKLDGDIVPLELPATKHGKLTGFGRALSRTIEIEAIDYVNLKKFTSELNVSEFMLLLSVYYVLLAKITGNEDIIIGTDVLGRTHPELTGVVGTFVNLLPLRLTVSSHLNYNEFLAAVKTCVLEAFENQDFQIDEIVTLLSERQKTSEKLCQVHFEFINFFNSELQVPGLKIDQYQTKKEQVTDYEFKLEVSQLDHGIAIRFIFCEELYDEETIEIFAQYYLNILRTVLTDDLVLIENIEIDANVM